jgi:hypothetical protein
MRQWGVPSSATPCQLKKAYHKKTLYFHPDKTNEKTKQDKFVQLQEVYTMRLRVFDSCTYVHDGCRQKGGF